MKYFKGGLEEEDNWIRTESRFGMQIYGVGYTGLERFMFHKKKRIDKKWKKNKSYYVEISYNPNQFMVQTQAI